jgi:hypothetical protein
VLLIVDGSLHWSIVIIANLDTLTEDKRPTDTFGTLAAANPTESDESKVPDELHLYHLTIPPSHHLTISPPTLPFMGKGTQRMPCIVSMDSFKGVHRTVDIVEMIRKYLVLEWRARKKALASKAEGNAEGKTEGKSMSADAETGAVGEGGADEVGDRVENILQRLEHFEPNVPRQVRERGVERGRWDG